MFAMLSSALVLLLTCVELLVLMLLGLSVQHAATSSGDCIGGGGGRNTMTREEAITEYDLHVDKSSWKPNNSSNKCSNCDAKFTFTRRKHHCRKCGELVCLNCSTQRVVIAAVGKNQKLRICDLCFGMRTWTEWKNLSI